MAAMRQPIQQGCSHSFALEELPPVAEGQIAGDQQAGPLVAVGEDLAKSGDIIWCYVDARPAW